MAASNNMGLLYLKDFKPRDLEYLCKKNELEEIAKSLDIKNRSAMKKKDLATAIHERLNKVV